MVYEDRRRRHAFSVASMVALLLTVAICAVFWSEVVRLVLRLT